jgi:CP family cyanate transporter-like MFS transporter
MRDPLAWQATTFFGLQSLIFYATISWLPSIYRDQGLSPTESGLLLSVTTLVAIPSGLVVAWRAGRARNQRAAAAGATTIATVGLIGLTLAPGTAPLAWAVILGIGQGITFPLALTILVLRSRSVVGTQRLSAMVQSIGYAIASLGPLAVGLLHDATGGWAAGLGLLVLLSLVQMAAGFMAGRDLTVAAT